MCHKFRLLALFGFMSVLLTLGWPEFYGHATEAPPKKGAEAADADGTGLAVNDNTALDPSSTEDLDEGMIVEKALPPTRIRTFPFNRMQQGQDGMLYGIRNTKELEFTIRRDQRVPDASLRLHFTPSPALLPTVSHMRVFLNEEMMGTVPINTDPPGQRQSFTLPLDVSYLSTYNRLRIEFVGHYTEICEDLANTALWLDLGQNTQVEIVEEMLPLANDLAFFPEPFFDQNDMFGQIVPFVFAERPDTVTQEAAGILASYLGTEADWRDLKIAAHVDSLPAAHAIVMATNKVRPDFLADIPPVEAPVVAMVDHPEAPYYKLLLVLGRHSDDLKVATSALAMGEPVLRGASVSVSTLQPLEPRKPYDAPNWTPTNRPVYFAELAQYPGQLQVSGLRPPSIRLPLQVPPDLFVWRSKGIPLDLLYRYTPPIDRDESRLTISLNDRFVAGYPLEPIGERSALTKVRLDVVGSDVADMASLRVPALLVGGRNELKMDFSFATTVGNASANTCRTTLPVDTRAVIDERSSVDFSGYAHYIEMPNLHVFGSSGFPFSRMADLSDTVVVTPAEPSTHEIALLLQSLAMFGAQTGYPAYRFEVISDWQEARQRDKDVLWIGETPEAFRERPDANLLLNHTQTRVTLPLRPDRGLWHPPAVPYLPGRGAEDLKDEAWRLDMRGVAPIAAIVGMASPWHPGRSMVGLLASTPSDVEMLQGALQDSGKRSAMKGSVVTIRSSGVSGEYVGPRYFVGDLSWWQRIWYHLSDKPWLLAIVATGVVLAIGVMLWIILGRVARRRLNLDA